MIFSGDLKLLDGVDCEESDLFLELSLPELRAAKNACFENFVVVIPKEGLIDGALPILHSNKFLVKQ